MSIVLLILKIIGWLLLGASALIFIALFIPVGIKPRYEFGRLTVRVKVLFLEFSVFDSDKTDSGEKSEDSEGGAEKEYEQEETKEKTKLDLELIRAIVRPAAGAAGFIIRKLRFSHIELRLIAGGYDAYKVGINTGRIWQAVGSGIAVCRSIWRRMQFDELSVIPDFLAEHGGQEKFACQITAQPVIILSAGFIFLKRYLSYKIKKAKASRRAEKEIEKNECKSA
ncbi:MAG: hypothetical protein RR829_02510 [Oscillospiraceae bacterium]